MEDIRNYESSSHIHHKKDHEHYKKKYHPKCHKHLYQMVQIETKDDEIHHGIVHSYDREKVYLLMSTQHERDDSNQDESRLFFPYRRFWLYGFPFFRIRRFVPFYPFGFSPFWW